MAYLTEKQFDFRSSALPEDKFGVVNFKGFEGFSTPYEFEIMLVSSDPEIDLTEVLQNPAVFTILREEGDIPFNGILAQFEQLHAVGEHVFYRAVLVPRFWWLSLTHHNQIFLDKTVPEIIGEVLEDGGLTTDDYEFRISNDYPKWEYICQYRESHQNFVSRWMEREGMYYFFEQVEKGEKLIITDSNMSHIPMAEGKTMYYSQPSALEEAHREEVISAIVCKQKLLPAKLYVNDYNYRKPSLSLSAEAEVLDRGRGDVHIYGEHFRTPEEGQVLARIRAEELLCREKRFHGESTIPFLRPGYLFELQNHYRDSFNQQYLTIELEHEGSQVGYLLAGIQEGLAKVEEQPYYRNSFVAIPSDVQYRHPKTAEKPTFNGTINARVDAEGTGEYAELDVQGRYKVRLPFDLSGRNDGRASHWLRMAQPYAGTGHGMHFPLHKGTEVLLTFVEGDPDRPIIASAVPNPETASPVTAANQTESVIQTAGNNKIRIEDLAGKERIIMESPTANSWLRIGAPNDPAYPEAMNTKLEGDSEIFVRKGTKWSNWKDPGWKFKEGVDDNCLWSDTKQDNVDTSTPGRYQVTYTINIDFDDGSQTQEKLIRDVIVLERIIRNNGIRIYTEGELVEESRSHQTVILDDDAYNQNFELSDATYASIFSAIEQENEHIRKNISIIDGLGVRWNLPYVGVKYGQEKIRLAGLQITQADKDQVKTKLEEIIHPTGGGSITKEQFVTSVEALSFKEDEIPGWTSMDENYPGKKEIIISAILRNTISSNAKHRKIEVSGDQINETDGSLKMSAINGQRTIEMTDQGIYIDAGKDHDITLQCRKFFLKNEDEDNITYGDDFMVHFGSNTELFYGDSYAEYYGYAKEYFRGDKLEEFHGSLGEWHMGHKIEGFLGPMESLALANTFELYGGLKEEVSIAGTFSVNPFNTELKTGLNIDLAFGFTIDWNKSVCIKKSDALEWKDAAIEGKSKKVKFVKGVASFITGSLFFNKIDGAKMDV